MKKTLMLPLLVLLAVAPPAAAQAPQGGPDDPLARYLFPPELVMAHQTAINLTDAQRGAIEKAIKEAQGTFVGIQFKMSAEAERLQQLLSPSNADEAKVLTQVDQVLTMEREVKKAQILLLIRIKNQLTPTQQEQLSKLRKQDPPRDWTKRPGSVEPPTIP